VVIFLVLLYVISHRRNNRAHGLDVSAQEPTPVERPRTPRPPPPAPHSVAPSPQHDAAQAGDEHAEEPADEQVEEEPEDTSDQDDDTESENLVAAPALEADITEVKLDLDDAIVEVVHVDGLSAVQYATNYPKHFSAEKGVITQSSSSGYADHKLTVKVPAAFKGSLNILTRNATSVKVDRWADGMVFIDHSSESELKLGPLERVPFFHILADGDGNIGLDAVNGAYGVVTLQGDGDLNMSAGFDLTGDLTINLFDDGCCTIAGAVKADAFTVIQNHNGAFKSAGINCNRYIKIDNRDDGNTTLTGDAVAPEVRVICEDDATITVPNIRAEGGQVVIKTGDNFQNADPQGTVKIGAVTGGSLHTTMNGNVDLTISGGVKLTGPFNLHAVAGADTNIAGVEALSADVTMFSSGSVDLGDCKLQRHFLSTQTAEGALTIHNVEAENYDSNVEGDGGLEITGKATVAKRLGIYSCGGGETNVAACDTDLLALTSDEDGGDINIKAGNAKCTIRTELGDGTISVPDSFTNVIDHPAEDENE
jgi:hypothetical protein